MNELHGALAEAGLDERIDGQGIGVKADLAKLDSVRISTTHLMRAVIQQPLAAFQQHSGNHLLRIGRHYLSIFYFE